jgi:hypothetical protein
MDTIPENNLFEITLSQEGASWLLRIYKITRWVFILGICLSVLHLTSVVLRYLFYIRYQADNNLLSIFHTKVFPFFEAVGVIVSFIQIYYYVTFSRTCKKGIEGQQADTFNDSFKWLYKHSVIAFILVIFYSIMALVAIASQLILFKTLH